MCKGCQLSGKHGNGLAKVEDPCVYYMDNVLPAWEKSRAAIAELEKHLLAIGGMTAIHKRVVASRRFLNRGFIETEVDKKWGENET